MASNQELPPTLPTKSKIKEDSCKQQITDGLMSLLGPSIESLDSKVHRVKSSQEELSVSIDAVAADLKVIASNIPNPQELDPHIKRITNAKRKLNIVGSILHNCQERMRKLHTNVMRETERKKELLSQQRTINENFSNQQNNSPNPSAPKSAEDKKLAEDESKSEEGKMDTSDDNQQQVLQTDDKTLENKEATPANES